jgi:RimJ/RimL family protein N-acetyltransferase
MNPEEQRVYLPKTSCVLLRSFERADIEALADIEYDEKVKKYLSPPRQPKQQWIADFANKVGTSSSFAVVGLPEKKLAGRAQLNLMEVFETGEREMEIVIGREFLGRGFGRLAAHTLITIAFREMEAPVVTGAVHPDNSASIALLKHFHFQKMQKLRTGSLRYALRRDVYDRLLK